MEERFTLVGIREEPKKPAPKTTSREFPIFSFAVLGILLLGCLLIPFFWGKNPAYMDLSNYNAAPSREFLFGTDTLGRDIFACIWQGGRISIAIGFLATLISTAIAILYGTLSGIAPGWLDSLMMRLTEVFLSVPTLLIILFLQAIFGKANVLSISIAIGITGWYSIAKVIRIEVRQLRSSEYVVASKAMGGGFFHVLKKHLAPNFVSSIMFMVVMNIRGAIGAESTLSFMGMGLPLEVISWGSMLSLSEKALMTGSWWMLLIPGAFLVTLLMCMTNIGNWLRKAVNRQESNI